MFKIGEFICNHVLTGYGHAKDHLEKSHTAESRAQRIFHSIIGNIERVPLIGSVFGLIEGIYHRVRSLSGRASASFPQEPVDRINEMVPLMLSTSLALAVERGDLNRVRDLIDSCADPNSIEFSRLFDQAQESGQLEIAKLLLEKQDPGEWISPLNSAIMHGYDEVTLAFIREGADLNQRSEGEGNTPAHLTALRGNFALLEALITAGADLTLRNNDDDTPLESLIRLGKEDTVAFLLTHKDRLGNYKEPAIKKAIQHKQFSIASLIIQS